MTPVPPVIINFNQPISALINHPTVVTCDVDGGKPKANVTWVVADSPYGTPIVREFSNTPSNSTPPIITEEVEPSLEAFGILNVRSRLRYTSHLVNYMNSTRKN